MDIEDLLSKSSVLAQSSSIHTRRCCWSRTRPPPRCAAACMFGITPILAPWLHALELSVPGHREIAAQHTPASGPLLVNSRSSVAKDPPRRSCVRRLHVKFCIHFALCYCSDTSSC
ncbi:hypothetical protein HBH70_165450 [Parastagonospora nodorum]|nr:hypothetical protein HBH46_093780 [Parastagonospora nodorum]KAH4114563.1 hypothetical protein HBH47_195420 [Parastagonospora nodorum]KAH4161052.1 hypothetical protein HBH43_174740 [Parastagonospora nodorum]KAH4201873.1 hypothetical protein HBI95_164390 [Parastagonospora nodorum]KAH4216113.1 hypothetical protein HBI06_236170 [Parastagonospora nodorum]